MPKTGSTSVQEALPKSKHDEHLGHRRLHRDINKRTKNYFKFTFARNPWDWLLSNYFWKCRIELKEHGRCWPCLSWSCQGHQQSHSFREWVLSHKGQIPWLKTQPIQYDWISDRGGNDLTDFIGRFENLQQDFNVVCDKIGIPRYQLPHKNKSKHKHYTEYYNDETKQIVAEKYAKDIEMFGYEFGE